MMLCDVVPCGKKYYARGWCKTHYNRWQSHGDPQTGGRGPIRCTVVENGEQCPNKVSKKRMCGKHAHRLQQNGDVLKVKRVVDNLRENEKWCPTCNEWVLKSKFSKNIHSPCGLQGQCRDCDRDRHRLKAYGITREIYDQMLSDQGGSCALCQSTSNRGRGSFFFSVDHDHSCCPGEVTCGQCVRALLCSMCNQGLGHFNDDPDLLLAAATYLISHSNNNREVVPQ
jgi:hypothetical protein